MCSSDWWEAASDPYVLLTLSTSGILGFSGMIHEDFRTKEEWESAELENQDHRVGCGRSGLCWDLTGGRRTRGKERGL